MASKYLHKYGYNVNQYTEGDTIEISGKSGCYKIVGIEDRGLLVSPVSGRSVDWDNVVGPIALKTPIDIIKAAPKKERAGDLQKEATKTPVKKTAKTTASSKSPSQSSVKKPADQKTMSNKAKADKAPKSTSKDKPKTSSSLMESVNEGIEKMDTLVEKGSLQIKTLGEKSSAKIEKGEEVFKEKTEKSKTKIRLLAPKIKGKGKKATARVRGEIKSSETVSKAVIRYRHGKEEWKEKTVRVKDSAFDKKLSLKKTGKYTFRVVSEDGSKSKKKTKRVK